MLETTNMTTWNNNATIMRKMRDFEVMMYHGNITVLTFSEWYTFNVTKKFDFPLSKWTSVTAAVLRKGTKDFSFTLYIDNKVIFD